MVAVYEAKYKRSGESHSSPPNYFTQHGQTNPQSLTPNPSRYSLPFFRISIFNRLIFWFSVDSGI